MILDKDEPYSNINSVFIRNTHTLRETDVTTETEIRVKPPQNKECQDCQQAELGSSKEGSPRAFRRAWPCTDASIPDT